MFAEEDSIWKQPLWGLTHVCKSEKWEWPFFTWNTLYNIEFSEDTNMTCIQFPTISWQTFPIHPEPYIGSAKKESGLAESNQHICSLTDSNVSQNWQLKLIKDCLAVWQTTHLPGHWYSLFRYSGFGVVSPAEYNHHQADLSSTAQQQRLTSRLLSLR